MNYYMHPESDSVILASAHPGDTCEEIGAVGPEGPSLADFSRCYQAVTGRQPPEYLLAAADSAIRAFTQPNA